MLRFHNTLGVIFGAGMNIVGLAARACSVTVLCLVPLRSRMLAKCSRTKRARC
jgi:hypothetical protein